MTAQEEGVTVVPRVRRIVRGGAESQRGMTLLEIMIVLAIIALVMGFLVGPRVLESFKEAKEETTHAVLKQFAYEAYPRWDAANSDKSCPAQLSDLLKYMNKKDTQDPWGSELVMFCGDNQPQGLKDSFGVLSLGPDKKQNSQDDIKSWD
jgi:prepilin-type N-terminal cleavage/methylation domain-containing protein